MLTKRSVTVPIGGGVDEADNDLAFDAPLVREAVNARFEKTGSVGKRHGEDALPSGLPSPSTYGEHNAVVEQDGRAIVLSQLGAYAHDPVRSTWAQLGNVQPRPSRCRTDSLNRQNNSSTEPEIALITVSSKTLACIVWGDTDSYETFYAWAEVPSDASPLRIVSGPTLFGGARDMVLDVRLTVMGSVVYAMAGGPEATTNVYTTSATPGSSYTFGAPATGAGWRTSASPVALLNDGSALFAVVNESGGGYSVRKLDTSFVETASQVVAGAAALDAILVGTDVYVIKTDGSVDSLPQTLAAGATNHPIVTLSTTAVRATLVETASSGIFCAWERGTGVEVGVHIAAVTSGWGVTSNGVVGTVRLAGRAAYRSAEAQPLLPVLDNIDTTKWRCGWIARPVLDASSVYTLTQVATFGVDLVHRVPTTRRLVVSNVFTDHTLEVCLPSLVYDSASAQWLLPYIVLSDASTAFAFGPTYGIDMLRLETLGAPAERSVSASGLRLLGGGSGPTYTDGVVHAEVTPGLIGVIDSPIAATDASGIFYTGTVAEAPLWIALGVRWRDEKGLLHRSPPLTVQEVFPWDAVGGLPDDQARRIRFPRPFPQNIRGDRAGQSYEVEVYAALVEDGPYYFQDVVTPRAHPTLAGVDFIIISWGVAGHAIDMSVWRSDGIDYIAEVADIGGGAGTSVPRWTDTDELVHAPCPPVVDLCSTQSRVWLLVAEQGRNVVRPSKLLTPGFAPEFPADLDIVVPSEGGECRAVAALADKVVVFKERQIYVIFGDPGDNTGEGATLQTPRLVPGDVGCKEPQSVVEGPFGVMFRSAAGGFHLLTPGLEVQRLPMLEDTLADYPITSGVLVADRKEVRWAITTGASAGKTLVIDYDQNAWLTHEYALATIAACTVRGFQVRIAYGGNVYTERDTWDTTLDSHDLKVTSAWIKLSGIQGFKRVWKSVYLLRWYSGDVIVRVGVAGHGETYPPEWLDVRTWTAAELGALDESDGTVQIVVQHTRQKCEAVRFQLEEDNPSGQDPPPRGQGFTLLGVTLECGVKKGSYAKHLPAAARK